MSQFWHANQMEEAFKPTRLQNWQLPRWHNEWPDRHCSTTKFEADLNGRLYRQVKKKCPWSDFKGTWELPLKIDRATANDLARVSEYRRTLWRIHRKKHERECRQGFENPPPILPLENIYQGMRNMKCGCDRTSLNQKEGEEAFEFEKENSVKSIPKDEIEDIKKDYFDEIEEASEKRKGNCLSAKNEEVGSPKKEMESKPIADEDKGEPQPEKMEKLSLKNGK